MVVLNRIYTRTGDDGTTSLGSGDRRKKYDLRVAAYGTLDEVNAAIGLARLHTGGDRALDADAGAHPERPVRRRGRSLPVARKGPGGARLTVTDAQVDWLEGEIDRLNAELAPLRSFILPGGTPAAAYLHLARTVCRRAERMMVELNDKPGEGVTPAALKYVNRLSDFLFVAGRHANDKGAHRRAVGAGPEPVMQRVCSGKVVHRVERGRCCRTQSRSKDIRDGDAALRRQSVHRSRSSRW